ncbi:MAG TPA: DUF1330 domain-containing protein [Solirubrobacteraceae bacterium]|jgi:uncharacterized protein (DUF1330 family)|nr:DUF1330 domain-containing protein [Solirubrobacteraceae bacterium]
MKGYAIGILNDVDMGPPVVEYLERIDSTLAPYGGRFIVHGDPADVREGANPGDVIIIEFPDRVHAAQWYESPAYQAILPLRTDNSVGTVLLIDGVDDDHRATDVLARAEAAQP